MKLSKIFQPSRSITLQMVMVVPFVVQISIAVGLTGYLSFRNGQEAVNDLASQLRQEVNSRINQHLDSYLDSPHLINQINANTIATNNFDLGEPRNLKDFLWKQMQDFPSVTFTGIGTQTGEYIGFERLEGELVFTILDQLTTGVAQDWGIDSQGNLTEILTTYRDYDPTMRPWYQGVVATGEPIWSDIFLPFGSQTMMIISANQPIYDLEGNLQGIATSGLSLTGISDFLQELKIGETGQTFIMETNGLLVATSTPQIPFDTQGKTPQRLLATQSNNPLISTTAKYIHQQLPNLNELESPMQMNFSLEGENHLLDVVPFRDQFGLNWLIVIVMPEADFMGQINANRRQTILLCLLALLIAIAMGIMTSQWLVGTILKMIYTADALSRGEWHHKLPDSSPRELGLLAKALNRMAWQLQDSFTRLEYIADHDPLTGLPNRTAFMEALKQAIVSCEEKPNRLFAVLFLDLDDFKLVNDSLGHLFGDQLLIAVADRLQACLDSNTLAARFGGDEFTILLREIESSEAATSLADKICQALSQDFSLKGHAIFVSASIGIVLSNRESSQPESFLRDADIAMYHAKAKGKGCYELFDAPMRIQTMARLQLETDLRQGIEQRDFEVYYQPIINLETKTIAGFEALIRWHHPTQGMISPGKFIPIAEETGLIVHLGEWVLSQACEQMAQWQSKFALTQSMFMSVNVSGKQLLQPGLLETIGNITKQTGLPPQSLKLELTESIIVNNVQVVSDKLIQLRSAGVQISVDDFGTGYSSLSYLHSFPLTTLKVDRSFVSRMTSQEESFEIAKAIIVLAHSLGMNVIAEGIETEEQWQQLHKLGCEYGQGFLFASPLSATAVTEKLRFNQLENVKY